MLHDDGFTRWGDWVFDRDRFVLVCRGYEVDLETCRTSAAVLDWICQVDAKLIMSDADSANLLRALRALLRPQRTLCSFALSGDTGSVIPEEQIRGLLLANEREALGHRLKKRYDEARCEALGHLHGPLFGRDLVVPDEIWQEVDAGLEQARRRAASRAEASRANG